MCRVVSMEELLCCAFVCCRLFVVKGSGIRIEIERNEGNEGP
jgi:hypothetical protein